MSKLDPVPSPFPRLKAEEWVHGRSKLRQGLNVSAKWDDPERYPVIQCTKRFQIAIDYAGSDGQIWVLSPAPGTKILELLSQGSKDARSLLDLIDQEIELNGNFLGTEAESQAILASFLPEDIVNNAEAYDDLTWTSWLWDNTGAGFVETPDGAVFIDTSSAIIRKKYAP